LDVCIIRNAEVETNASVIRIIDALLGIDVVPITLSRSRLRKSLNEKIKVKTFMHKTDEIPNYEIQIPTDRGRGLINIFQLVNYQITVFLWLMKNRRKYDILHAFDLDAGIPAVLGAKLLNKKIVYHIADFYADSRKGIPNSFKKLVSFLEFKLINSSDATIICTDERKEQIKGSNPRRLHVIYNTPIHDFEDNVGNNTIVINKDSIVLCYVGTLAETRFIKQILDIVKRRPEITLNIAGIGPLENYVSNTAKYIDNVNYFGELKYDDALKLYSRCDLMFAMYDPNIANHKYSAPNKIYEAMMLEKPIIVAKGTGIDKIVEREKIGFTINYNEKSFEELLNKIVTNKKVLDEVRLRMRDVYPKFSWDLMKKRIHKIYSEIDESTNLKENLSD